MERIGREEIRNTVAAELVAGPRKSPIMTISSSSA